MPYDQQKSTTWHLVQTTIKLPCRCPNQPRITRKSFWSYGIITNLHRRAQFTLTKKSTNVQCEWSGKLSKSNCMSSYTFHYSTHISIIWSANINTFLQLFKLGAEGSIANIGRKSNSIWFLIMLGGASSDFE